MKRLLRLCLAGTQVVMHWWRHAPCMLFWGEVHQEVNLLDERGRIRGVFCSCGKTFYVDPAIKLDAA